MAAGQVQGSTAPMPAEALRRGWAPRYVPVSAFSRSRNMGHAASVPPPDVAETLVAVKPPWPMRSTSIVPLRYAASGSVLPTPSAAEGAGRWAKAVKPRRRASGEANAPCRGGRSSGGRRRRRRRGAPGEAAPICACGVGREERVAAHARQSRWSCTGGVSTHPAVPQVCGCACRRTNLRRTRHSLFFAAL